MNGKNILIVGASSGIGKAIANIIGSQGTTIILDLDPDLEASINVIHLNLDIEQEEIPSDFLPSHLDGLVYCPGTINLKPFRSLSLDAFKNDFNVNVLGAVSSIKGALKSLKKSDSSPSIVLFSTVAVQQGMAFHSSVVAAKGAIEVLSSLYTKKDSSCIPKLISELDSLTEQYNLPKSIDTMHHLDSLLAWISGYRFQNDKHLEFGSKEEGIIII